MPDPSCFDPAPDITPPTAPPPKPPLQVTIDDINIDELDVTASGLVAVRRCDTDGNPVDILVCKDENHADGHGDTTDTGTFETMIIGWMSADDATIQPAGTLPTLGPCPSEIATVKLLDECTQAIGNSTGGPWVDGDQGTLVTCVTIDVDGVLTSAQPFLWINGAVVEPGDFELEDFRDCDPCAETCWGVCGANTSGTGAPTISLSGAGCDVGIGSVFAIGKQESTKGAVKQVRKVARIVEARTVEKTAAVKAAADKQVSR